MYTLYPDVVPDGVTPEPIETTTTAAETTTTQAETTTTAVVTTTAAIDEPVKDADWGNVDCSEGASPQIRVDVADAVLLAKYLAEDATANVSAQGKANADVNASGSPDTEDTTKILKFVAKLIDYEDLGKK
jgi:hypothetical protein